MLFKSKHKFISLILIITPPYYNFITNFDKNIKIKNKYIKYNKTGLDKNSYMITDNNNNIYLISNKWWFFQFNNEEIWNNIEKNKKYKIKGYGKRITFLNMYPNIYSVENNDL